MGKDHVGMPGFSDFKMSDIGKSTWLLDNLAFTAKPSTKTLTLDWDLFHDFVRNGSDFNETWPRIVKMETPALSVSGTMLIFAGIALLLALFFCCCCMICDLCNGYLTAEELKFQSLTEFLALIVVELAMLTTYAVMANLMIGCCVRSHWVNNQIETFAQDTIKDTSTFMNDTRIQLDYLISNSQNDYFIKKTGGIQLGLMSDVTVALDPVLNDFTGKYADFTNEQDQLNMLLQEVSWSCELIIETIHELQQKLSSLSVILQVLKDKCPNLGYGAVTCDGLPSSADVPDPTSQINEQDLTLVSVTLPSEFLKAVESVSSTINPAEIRYQLTEALPEQYVQELHEKLLEMSPELAASVKSGLQGFAGQVDSHFSKIQNNVSTLEPHINYFLGIVMPYFKFGEYLTYILTSLLVFTIAVALTGELCGFFGMMAPSTHGAGTRSLQTVRGYHIFRCSILLMLITTHVFFIILAGFILFSSQLRMVCKTVDSLDIFDEIIDNSTYFSFDKDIFEAANLSDPGPSVKSILLKCRNDTTVFEALNFNIEKPKTDVETAILSAGTFNKITIDGVGPTIIEAYSKFQPIVTATLNSTILSLKNLAETYNRERMAKAYDLGIDMGDIDKLGKLARTISRTGDLLLFEKNESRFISDYRSLGTKAGDILTDIISGLQPLVESIGPSWETITQLMSALAPHGREIVMSSVRLVDHVKKTAPGIYLKFIQSLTTEIKSWEHELIVHINNELETEVGRCRAVWDIYRGLVSVPCYHLPNCMDAFWLLLLLNCVFMFLNTPDAVRLTRHFKKADDEEDYLANKEENERRQEEIAADFEANMMIPEKSPPKVKRPKKKLDKKQPPKGAAKFIPKSIRDKMKKTEKKQPLKLSNQTREVIEKYKQTKACQTFEFQL